MYQSISLQSVLLPISAIIQPNHEIDQLIVIIGFWREGRGRYLGRGGKGKVPREGREGGGT